MIETFKLAGCLIGSTTTCVDAKRCEGPCRCLLDLSSPLMASTTYIYLQRVVKHTVWPCIVFMLCPPCAPGATAVCVVCYIIPVTIHLRLRAQEQAEVRTPDATWAVDEEGAARGPARHPGLGARRKSPLVEDGDRPRDGEEAVAVPWRAGVGAAQREGDDEARRPLLEELEEGGGADPDSDAVVTSTTSEGTYHPPPQALAEALDNAAGRGDPQLGGGEAADVVSSEAGGVPPLRHISVRVKDDERGPERGAAEGATPSSETEDVAREAGAAEWERILRRRARGARKQLGTQGQRLLGQLQRLNWRSVKEYAYDVLLPLLVAGLGTILSAVALYSCFANVAKSSQQSA